MGSCAAPSAKGDDKFITTDYLQQCPFINGKLRDSLHHLCCIIENAVCDLVMQNTFVNTHKRGLTLSGTKTHVKGFWS
ncbi:hypothetical protein SND29_00030, partial [Escherichia coli]|nr:hypothetical protein [Escherichia coli]